MTDSPANLLCKACGLCCSGHLFSWVRLNAPELDPVQNLGVKVIRDDPRQRGFTQPCPMWHGTCTIYEQTEYPRSCRNYKCQILRRLLDDDISLPDALSLIEETLHMIREIEPLLPGEKSVSFRERLIEYKEAIESRGFGQDEKEGEFVQKAEALLSVYADRFGVDDFIDYEK